MTMFEKERWFGDYFHVWFDAKTDDAVSVNVSVTFLIRLLHYLCCGRNVWMQNNYANS